MIHFSECCNIVLRDSIISFFSDVTVDVDIREAFFAEKIGRNRYSMERRKLLPIFLSTHGDSSVSLPLARALSSHV